jgi:hypothetical protein
MAKRYISNSFPFIYDALKYGSDPLTVRSSFRIDDVITSADKGSNLIARRLIEENFNALQQGLSLLSSDKKGIVHYIQNTLLVGLRSQRTKHLPR